jgi:hypothetical protein
MAAAADGDRCPSAQPKLLALLVHDFKITFDAYGAVAEDRHFSSCHEFLRVITRKLHFDRVHKITREAAEYKNRHTRQIRFSISPAIFP